MKNSLLPFAIGVVASISLPLPTQANESTVEADAIASSEVPVLADATGTESYPHETIEPTSSATEMPVAKDSFYVEASGALNFDPTAGQATVDTAVIANSGTSEKPMASSSGDTTQAARSQTREPAAAKDLFEGGSESFVARTVGAAEGTRTADGGKTQNYHGHVDPGNGVWNRGTFSYQFGNAENLSPDEADRRQLAKIKRIYESVMLSKAEKHGVAPLTLAEEINGIDLINQAPLTVTEDGGYIERLAEAKQKGLTGDEAILNARIWAFWDPGKGGWDAPGLRAYDDISKEESIRRDQDRRMGMIAKAMAAYERENGAIARRASSSSKVASADQGQDMNRRNAIANAIISGEKPATRG